MTISSLVAAEMEIRKAMEAGIDPWAIAELIAQHPDSFSKRYFLVSPGKKLQPLQPIQVQQVH